MVTCHGTIGVSEWAQQQAGIDEIQSERHCSGQNCSIRARATAASGAARLVRAACQSETGCKIGKEKKFQGSEWRAEALTVIRSKARLVRWPGLEAEAERRPNGLIDALCTAAAVN